MLAIAGTIIAVKQNQSQKSSANQIAEISGTMPQVRNPIDTENLAEVESLGILLLGYGGPGHSGGFLTDVIQVLHINFAKQRASLISIPRDLWVTTQSGHVGKINEAYASSSGVDAAKQMAAQVTGIPIDYFVGIDFVGLQRAIGENLKGIEVEVSETLDDPWYPVQGLELETCGMTAEEVAEVSSRLSGFELEKQFPCRYERVYFPAGTHHMEGGDVLAFVRSRHGSGSGDFSRSKRQHEVLDAVVKKMLQIDAFTNSVEFFESLSHTITTDITAKTVLELTPKILAATEFPKVAIILSTENVLTTGKSAGGQFVLLPKTGANDWQSTQDFIQAAEN